MSNLRYFSAKSLIHNNNLSIRTNQTGQKTTLSIVLNSAFNYLLNFDFSKKSGG